MLALAITNLPQLAVGLCWTAFAFDAGRRFGRWRARRAARFQKSRSPKDS